MIYVIVTVQEKRRIQWMRLLKFFTFGLFSRLEQDSAYLETRISPPFWLHSEERYYCTSVFWTCWNLRHNSSAKI